MKIKTPILIVLGVVGSMFVLLVFGYLLLVVTDFPFIKPFYKDCVSIQVGMSRSEVREIMRQHIDNEKMWYESREDGEFFADEYSGMMNDYSCNVYIEDDAVTRVFKKFD